MDRLRLVFACVMILSRKEVNNNPCIFGLWLYQSTQYMNTDRATSAMEERCATPEVDWQMSSALCFWVGCYNHVKQAKNLVSV